MKLDQGLISQYREIHKRQPKYGHAATYRNWIEMLAKDNDVKTILDYGCGKGKLSDDIEKHTDIKCWKYDPAIEEFSDLPPGMSDMVVSNDVLEHLTGLTVRPVLNDIFLRGNKVIFLNISCRPAHQILPDGKNAHTLIKDPFDWKTFIDDIATRLGWEMTEEKFSPINRNLVLVYTRPE